MPSTRTFLGWNRPILELASDWLLDQADPRHPDLSSLLVVVPTRNAGRRLRERLALACHERGQGILPPRVLPPEGLLHFVSRPPQGRVAAPEEALLAWVDVLLRADLEDFPALFPVKPVSQDFSWALRTAEALAELRRNLGEAGLDIANVAGVVGDDMVEPDRWRELTRLEARFREILATRDLHDLLTVRRQHAASPDRPEELSRIAVIGCPDPLPLSVGVLEALSVSVIPEILIHAPPDFADTFDEWGRPLTAFWSRHPIAIPAFDDQVHVVPGPAAQAQEATRRAASYEEPAASVALGVLDEEVVPLLEESLHRQDIPTFNPQGSPLRARGPIHLLRALRNLLRSRSYADYLELLRCPDYGAFLARSTPDWETPRVLSRLDALYELHLPQDLAALSRVLETAARDQPELRSALERTTEILHQLEERPLPEFLPGLLVEIFSARPSSTGEPHRASEEVLHTLARRLRSGLQALTQMDSSALAPSGPDAFDFVLRFLESESLYEERRPDAVELLGWLELPWDDAPHLVVTGFNDGFVPDSIVGDIYLPETLRRRLAQRVAFKTNEQRFARDAYLLQAMLQSRAENGGRIDLFLGKRSFKGEPLRPSRLLFLCPDDELAPRAKLLFRDLEERVPGLHWTPGFPLRPAGLWSRAGETVSSLRVTAFRDYLSSPFHFYLRHVEEMRPVDDTRIELDAAGFGNLVHEVLRRFGQEAGVRDSDDEAEVRDFLLVEVDTIAAQWFGADPSLPVRIQLDSARQRLRHAAAVQVRERSEGWRIACVEAELGEGEWILEAVHIRGRVDRVDRHEDSGAVRVLDYKTSEKALEPRKAHVSSVTAATNRVWLPEYARFEIAGKPLRWKDLQLPLYRLGLADEFETDIACGYFNLPKAVTETGIRLWNEIDPAWDDAALECARGILRDIGAGRFWPCPEPAQGDEFASLHLGRPEATIDPAHLLPE